MSEANAAVREPDWIVVVVGEAALLLGVAGSLLHAG